MDRNQVIGIALVMGLLVAYFAFFRPKPTVPDSKIADTTVHVKPIKDAPALSAKEDSAQQSVLQQRLGDLSTAAQGQAQSTVLENNEVQIVFNSKGATIERVLLKKYLTNEKKPLFLITPESNKISLIANTDRGDVNLNDLYYQLNRKEIADTTILEYKVDLGAGKFISQTYKFPKNGYTVDYAINMQGVDHIIKNAPLKFSWKSDQPLVENDLGQNRQKSTVNYYTVEEGFDNLSESETSKESETVNAPLKWVSMKQKFFNTSIIAKNQFEKGYVEADIPADINTVKSMTVDLTIPIGDVKTQKADYKYYFGPNHFQTLKKVTEDFDKNVYLGIPVINWINRFVVIPTFNFLDHAFGTMHWKYGLIILILGIFVKLILLPLSYKSQLSMAKMKVMKPELDEIKEKYGDDMQKVQAEQMSLYSKVGINPLSGCIPVLLSMPVLLAMFSFFPNAIELRQEAFLWAHDLSTYDAPFKLPFKIPAYGAHVSVFTLLMTLSTLALTHFNSQMNTATGPMKSLSYVMPVVFMFVLNSFPAGLSFYYLVSNLLTIAQQFIIKRFVDEDKIKATLEENRKKSASGEGKKSKFMDRVQEAMKAKEEQQRNKKKKD